MTRLKRKTELEGLIINHVEELQKIFKFAVDGIELYNRLRNEYLHEGINIQVINGEDLEIYNEILEDIKEEVKLNRGKTKK